MSHPARATEMARLIEGTAGSPDGPRLMERLGVQAAELVNGHTSAPISLVVVWDQADTGVLGHVVARELVAGMLRASVDLGRVEFDGPVPPGASTAVVSIDWRESLAPEVLLTALEGHGAVVRVIAAVTGAVQVRHPATDNSAGSA